ncbi:hypothetical protein M408DRAFT_334389 [Serendipita vermifera MAFF 305830]|uniref:Uncharacterized protein n=1 Tax=Serendipita vermifera MAFF 305830 TaxID=933852 RepID=A0A0C3A487_SERVB|nr:hypothetical protein M408DRAFT_334389 [Serendipita vermifera MAFF 305830]
MADPSSVQNMRVYEIPRWRIDIADRLDWRRRDILSDLERILLICSPSPLNSAAGGFVPRYRLPATIREACERVTIDLPARPEAIPDAELSANLNTLIDNEAEFLNKMREDGHDLGPEISPESFRAIKENLGGHLRTVNGLFIDMDLLNEVPGEDFRARVRPGFFSDGMGRSMALHWDRMQSIHELDGVEFDDLRLSLGVYVNIWRLLVVQTWWGLMVVMLCVLLKPLNPLFIVGYGVPAAHMFTQSTIALLATETSTDDCLHPGVIQHPHIRTLMASPQYPGFLSVVGRLLIVSTGPSPNQLALYLPMIHPGHEFYRPWLLLCLLRVGFLVAFKGHVTRRVLAHLAASSPPDNTADGRRAVLLAVREEVEKRLEKEGLATLLTEWLVQLQDAETADGVLRGRHVVHGELVRYESGRSKLTRGRTSGSVAVGQPFSRERSGQLDQLRQLAHTASRNGLQTFSGPQGCAPHSELFGQWLLGREEGVSLLWSANRYGRSRDAFEAVQRDYQRLASYNKLEALRDRQALEGRYGSYRRAVLLVRFETAARETLRGKCTDFAQATRVMTCSVCLEPDIGHDQNTQHRCHIEDDADKCTVMTIGARSTVSRFGNYLRVMFLHELIEYPRMLDFVTEDDLTEMGISSTPALRFLTDASGFPLPSLPPGLDLSGLEDLVWHREDTEPRILLASALVIALRAMAEKGDLSRAEQDKLTLGDIYSRHQHTLSNKKFGTSLMSAIAHNSRRVKVCIHLVKNCGMVSVRSSKYDKWVQMEHVCNRGKGEKPIEAEHQFLEVSRFVGLPYVLQRVCVYKAFVEGEEGFKRVLAWG